MAAVKLDQNELNETLKLFDGRRGQLPRLVRYLAHNPDASTVFVNTDCAIGNISDVARAANQKLQQNGLFISCKRPDKKIENKFGEPSHMWQWGIYRINPKHTQYLRFFKG